MSPSPPPIVVDPQLVDDSSLLRPSTTRPPAKRKSSCDSDDMSVVDGQRPLKARKRLDREVWESHHKTIRQLYHQERRPLKEVMEIMKREHGFEATVKMYKSRIWKWGLDKKLKGDEVLTILYLQRERELQGKAASEFTIRGQPVDIENINRYLRRKPALLAKFQSGVQPNHHISADVACRSPPPRPAVLPTPPGSTCMLAAPPTSGLYLAPPIDPVLPLPGAMGNAEHILRLFRQSLDVQFQLGLWKCEYDVSCVGVDGEENMDIFERVIASFAMVNRCMARGDILDLRRVLGPSFSMLLLLFKSNNPAFLMRTPVLIWYLNRHHKHDLLQMLARHILEMAELFPEDVREGTSNHAIYQIWRLLDQTLHSFEFCDFQELALRMYAILCPDMEQRIGAANHLTHILFSDYSDCLYAGKRKPEAEYVMRKHLQAAQATGQKHEWMSDLAFDHHAAVTAILDEQGQFEEALRLHITYLRENDLTEDQEALLILQVGVHYSKLNDLARALPCFKEAFRLAVDLDMDERVFLSCAGNLEKTLSQLGRDEQAYQIKQYRIRRLAQFGEESMELCGRPPAASLDPAIQFDPDFPEWLWGLEEQVLEFEPVWRTIPSFYSMSHGALSTGTLAPNLSSVSSASIERAQIYGLPGIPSPPERRTSGDCLYVASPQWTDYSHSPNLSIATSPARFGGSPPQEPQPAIVVLPRDTRVEEAHYL